MQVKKRLQINAAVSISIAVIILLVSSSALYRINKANKTAVIAGEIVATSLERVTLRNDYMRNDNLRAKEQWAARQEQFTRLLKSAAGTFGDPDDRVIIAKLQRNNASIGKIFSAIIANREKQRPGAGATGLYREVEDRLLSQLDMRVYEAVVLSRGLVDSSRETRTSAIRLAGLSILLLVLTAIGAAIANSRGLSRTVNDRIQKLRQGASVIGEGDLAHRIDIEGDDEFVELSRAFNTMTDKLRESRASLEKEVEERKKAEAARETNAYHRSLLEASLDPLVTISAEGKITDVNEAAINVTGVPREVLIGTDFSNYFTEPAKAREGYQRVFAKGYVTDYPLTIRHQDGRLTEVLYNASVYRDAKGTVQGVFAAARDITERKKAEEIVKLDEKRMSSIIEISQYPAASLQELLDFALAEAIALSSSKLGYLYFYDENTREFALHSWSREVMEECRIPNPQTVYQLDRTGIWGEVVRQRKPIIVNDFAAPHPLKKGYPEGHAHLSRFFSIPVFADGRIVAVVGVANKPAEYTDSDVRQLSLLMDSIWTIAERKRAEVSLRQASAYNRSLLEASLDPLVTIAADGKITDVNTATEIVTGYSRNELIGTDFSDYFVDREKARTGYQQVFREGSVKDYALEIRHKEARTTPVLYNASVYRNEAGQVAGVFAAARDITERRESERRSALTNELLKLYTRKFSRKEYLDVAVELIRGWSGCAHTGIRLADQDGNIPYESCVGYDREFLASENALSIKTDRCICTRVVVGVPDSSELMDMTLNGSFYSNDTSQFVDRLSEQQRGQYRRVCMRYGFRSLAVVPIRHGGQVLGAIHIADERPGTVPLKKVEFIEQLAFILGEALFRFGIEEELRQLNRELEQRVNQRTAQLEAANKELEAFAYSVSHDLRTPLRSIDGFSNAILEDYAHLLDDEGKDYFSRIKAAAGKMGQLIDALLSLSRLTRGELNRVPVNLSRLAGEISADLRKSDQHRVAEFTIAKDMVASGDPIMLHAVFENLLSNAWKFTGKRRQAKIEVGVTDKKDGQRIYFVRDNGAGFDMAYQNKLFAAFHRLHSSNDFPGIGIGLATVQRIVHRHGGRIWAESEIDKGTTIYFTL